MDISIYITKSENQNKIYKRFKNLITSLNLLFINKKIYLLYTESKSKNINHVTYYYSSENIIDEYSVEIDEFLNQNYTNSEINKISNSNFYYLDPYIIYFRGFIDRKEYRLFIGQYGDGVYISKKKIENKDSITSILSKDNLENKDSITSILSKDNYEWIEFGKEPKFVVAETRQALLNVNGIYYLFLRCNADIGKRNIYLMKSENLITWEQPKRCKINKSFNYNIYYPNIWIKNNNFYGLFSDQQTTRYFIGKSSDGIEWTTKEILINNMKDPVEIVSGVIEKGGALILFLLNGNNLFQIKIPESIFYKMDTEKS